MDLYTHSKVTTTLHNVFVMLMYCWEAEIWNPVGEFQELAISHIYPHSTVDVTQITRSTVVTLHFISRIIEVSSAATLKIALKVGQP